MIFRTIFRLHFLLMACSLALFGCTSTGVSPSDRGLSWSNNEVDQALAYYQHIRKLSPTELNREYEQVGQAFSQSKDDLARLQLAMLLGTPNSNFRDDGVALNLLKDWVKEAKPPYKGLRALGVIQITLIEDLREKDKRVDTLQKKLDALKSMEKNLLDREKR